MSPATSLNLPLQRSNHLHRLAELPRPPARIPTRTPFATLLCTNLRNPHPHPCSSPPQLMLALTEDNKLHISEVLNLLRLVQVRVCVCVCMCVCVCVCVCICACVL